ncbi:MAG: DEAD/DEAH box helicase family protein [bacterium]|nr:DEAD/DEAH box helicase family protein [bacterium]
MSEHRRSPQIVAALDQLSARRCDPGDGIWLEEEIAATAPDIREWDLNACWRWKDWPDREARFPGSSPADDGIDAVGIRRSDRGLVAIQCKARKLDDTGTGNPIGKDELDSFGHHSAADVWEERWLITNGNAPLSAPAARSVALSGKTIKVINFAADLEAQAAASAVNGDCQHCAEDADPGALRSKSCMQDEAVAESVATLRAHADSTTSGSPRGRARGKIVLPCGTGKTRISLRIVEELCGAGDTAVVLCPSIALVAQLRREYLIHAAQPIRSLSVCSDQTAGHFAEGGAEPLPGMGGSKGRVPKPAEERHLDALRDDPTLDLSHVSVSEIKGRVTTDPDQIKDWIASSVGKDVLNVIFGTYQSSHRIGEALLAADAEAMVLVADEAHRTAGLRRTAKADEEKLRDFTVCHDDARFPAVYRVYQTATPRVYDGQTRPSRGGASGWVVRDMDDEATFGVELYRRTYTEAVRNGWLADYRIIALGVNDPALFALANQLARSQPKTKNALSAAEFTKGLVLALVLGGATGAEAEESGEQPPVVESCIAFLNSVEKSKAMAAALQTVQVTEWVARWMADNSAGSPVPFTMEHLDASSSVSQRDEAKVHLAQATPSAPHAVSNVGIFGEGTDSPNLSAVAFLAPRKSPIDVIQAVGRAMRATPGKATGYIVCPVLIPPDQDAERWLQISGPEDGWQELGQTLRALRAHDSRIEDNLAEQMIWCLPPSPSPDTKVVTVVSVAGGETGRLSHRLHVGKPGDAANAVEDVATGRKSLSDPEFHPFTQAALDAVTVASEDTEGDREGSLFSDGAIAAVVTGKPIVGLASQPSVEIRTAGVARDKPADEGTPGPVNIDKTKKLARKMINNGEGQRVPTRSERRKRRTKQDRQEHHAAQLLRLSGMADGGNAICANLLSKSGLARHRTERDANLLEDSVREAARHLRSDSLAGTLNEHYELDRLAADKREQQADGCTIAALLMMNAAMLHQRIAAGGWLAGVPSMDTIKASTNPIREIDRAWQTIRSHDFDPVIRPAVQAVHAIEDTGRTVGLERALHHIAAEAERLAETYADLGADHAGPLFNRVMGNQASDGAYFTRPAAATLTARLALDACRGDSDEPDWADESVWKDHKAIDLACGSGTLLAALLADMKRRARAAGASEQRLAELQRVAVESVVKGMDINPVSLQLAAAQLTQGNQDIRYRKMGLYLMPYGEADPTSGRRGSAGSLELLGQRKFLQRPGELPFDSDIGGEIGSQRLALDDDLSNDAELEDAVDAALDCRIVVMNPPFTNRTKMGEKFKPITRANLRDRSDCLQRMLCEADPSVDGVLDKNSIHPVFATLGERCLTDATGAVLAMISPTILATNASGLAERRWLASRLHLHTVLTNFATRDGNLSQNTEINESVFVFRRYDGPHPPTRVIALDRFPADERDTETLHSHLRTTETGTLPDGWGEISYWPAERVTAGDWTAAVWRSPELAAAAAEFASHDDLAALQRERERERERISGCAQDQSNAQRPVPQNEERGRKGQVMVHATLQTLYTDYRKTESRREATG